MPLDRAEPAIRISGLRKTFEIVKRKKTAVIETNTVAALNAMLRQAFSGKAQDNSETVRLLHAVSDFDLDVMPGEVLGIIGRNGAGKSTVLKILARVLDPSAGTITIRGRVVSLLELGLGFAPELPLRDNIRLYGQLAGLKARRVREVEDGILEFAGLSDHADVPLSLCPSGSFVRLAFAAMINIDADVILADEVLAVGDKRFRAACEARIRNAGQSGEAVLFVSHDMEAIRRVCSRVIWIDQGRLKMSGPTNEVVDAYVADLTAGRLAPAAEAGTDLASSGRILDLSLASADGAPIGALQMDADAYLQCLVRLERQGIVGRVRAEIWNGGMHVLTTLSPWSKPTFGAETLRARVRLPAHFFNERSYKVKASLVLAIARQPEETAVTGSETLDFSVMNTDNEGSVWAGWNWGRPGVVSPRLAWTGPQAGEGGRQA